MAITVSVPYNPTTAFTTHTDTTGAFTPAAADLLIAITGTLDNDFSAPPAPNQVLSSSPSLTWTQDVRAAFASAASEYELWHSSSTTAVSTTVTCADGPNATFKFRWAVLRVSGANTTTPVVQTKTVNVAAADTTTSSTVTLDTAATTGNLVVAVIGFEDHGDATTPAGWTLAWDADSAGFNNPGMYVVYRTDFTGTAITFSHIASAGIRSLMAVEIAQAGAAAEVITGPQPLPPEVILAQYGIDPWAMIGSPSEPAAPVTNAAAEVATGTGSALGAAPKIDARLGGGAAVITDRGTVAATPATATSLTVVSGAFTPAAGSMVATLVTSRVATGFYEAVVTDNFGDSGGTAWAMTVHSGETTCPAIWTRTIGTGAASGTITASSSAELDNVARAIVATFLEVAGLTSSTPTQTQNGFNALTAITLTLPGTPAASSLVLSVGYESNSVTGPTQPSGYTLLDARSFNGNDMAGTAYKNGSAAAALTWTGSGTTAESGAAAAEFTTSGVGGTATGTGTAYQATVSTASNVNANAGNAAGTGSAPSPTAKEAIPATLASGTGTASNATVSTSATANAGLASGTGTANNASPSTSASSNAGVAAGTGTAPAATTKESPNAGNAAGTGTAYDPSVSTSSFTNANAQHAAGTASASSATPTQSIPATLAAGTGSAQNATVSTGMFANAGNAAGTGTVATPTTLETVSGAPASGTGTAPNPTAKESIPAGLGTGTGLASNAAAVSGTFGLAGVATGTGTGYNVGAGLGAGGLRVGYLLLQSAPSSLVGTANAEHAAGTGSAGTTDPKISRVPVAASGTGSANNATVNTGGSTGFPDTTNTGIPTGTPTLTASGPITASTNGQTFTEMDFLSTSGGTSAVTVTATGVTFNRCRFRGPNWYVVNVSGGASVTFNDCEFAGTLVGNTVSGNGVKRVPDALLCDGTATLNRCYLHDATSIMIMPSQGLITATDCYITDNMGDNTGGRHMTDGVTNGSTTITSATAAFGAGDIGSQIWSEPPAILGNSNTIVSVTNSTTAIMAKAATSSGSGREFWVATLALGTHGEGLKANGGNAQASLHHCSIRAKWGPNGNRGGGMTGAFHFDTASGVINVDNCLLTQEANDQSPTAYFVGNTTGTITNCMFRHLDANGNSEHAKAFTYAASGNGSSAIVTTWSNNRWFDDNSLIAAP